jgi:hypothetical protein
MRSSSKDAASYDALTVPECFRSGVGGRDWRWTMGDPCGSSDFWEEVESDV